MARKILSCLSLVLTSVFLAVFSSLNSYALELNLNVTTLWGNYVPNPVEYVLAQPNNYGSGLFVCYNTAGGNWNRVRGVNFSLPSGYTPQSGDLIEFSFNATSGNNQNVNIAFGAQATANGWDVVSWDFENATNSAGALKVILVAGSSATRNISLMRPEGWTIFDLNENECVGISNIGIYRPVGDGSQAIVNAINNSNSTQAVNDAKREIVSAINDTKSVQEQANDDANDRYNDEKDTINDNGDTARDSAGDLSFSGFSVGNPLLNWIALFTDNTCVSIPTIASWIHSNETQVCSPWSSSVRGVTTPIITVLSGTILFGFIVHWLKQKDGQELS